MNSKDFLKFGSSSLIMGSSLASLVGMANVDAQGPSGSIKNFFLKNKTKNKEKKLSLRERKEKYNQEASELCAPENAFLGTFLFGVALSGMLGIVIANDPLTRQNTTSEAAAWKAMTWGFIISALTAVGCGVYSYIKKENANKEFVELKKSIEEDKLEKQWKFEKFKEMAEKDDGESKRFLEQLLVLEPSSSENKDEDVPLLDKDNLSEKVQAFKELFTEEPEKLRDNNKKEIYKEIINSLFNWCSGKMERLYDDSREGRDDEEKYFKEQEDKELASKIVLLKEIVLGENINYPECLSFLTSEDLYKNLTDENEPNFKKLLLYDIRRYVSAEDVSDEYIINILKELTSSNLVGTIKSKYDRLTHREVKVAVVSADYDNISRCERVFSEELKTFSKEREEAKEKNESVKTIYEKQLKILKEIKDFFYQKHILFYKRFGRSKNNDPYKPVENLEIVDSLSFRAQAAYNGISKEYEERTRLKS